jgi:pentose-5-phosphate-3-epimerase
VNLDTVAQATQAGANVAVVGTALFHAKDPKADMAEYQRIIQKK